MTDETKYTPGPWKAHTEMDGRHGHIAICTEAEPWATGDDWPYHPKIVSVHAGARTTPRPIAEANAHLIAAAPELLDALRAFMGKIDLACLVEKDHPQADLADEWRQGIAAISKAEGRSE